MDFENLMAKGEIAHTNVFNSIQQLYFHVQRSFIFLPMGFSNSTTADLIYVGKG